jgi:hypothetical protein
VVVVGSPGSPVEALLLHEVIAYVANGLLLFRVRHLRNLLWAIATRSPLTVSRAIRMSF